MSSSRRTVPALLAATALLACAGAGATASAASLIGGGLTGYVTDADTGLGLGGAALTWNGTTAPAPSLTSDAAGRFLFTGLDAGSTGALAVAGPAGYERTTIDGITLPANDLGTQNVAIHRDWSAGAPTTAAPDATAAPGCAPAQATDDDRATGWSTTQPAALTVALPVPVDTTTVVLTPGGACGHGDGAALKDYKIETSPDGVTWSDAASGSLSGANDAPVSVTANGVRYVRVAALSAQDGGSTIDLRELQVFGGGPNVAPTGTISTDSPKNYIKTVVRFRAAFKDPDSTILRYLWDFDGDGRFDQATTTPQVAHVWAAAGTYHLTVGARDFRGALGTTTFDLRVIDPSIPVEPIIQRKPLITFDPVDGIDLPVRIACSSVCTFTAKLVLSKQTAKAIKSKRRTILTMKKKTEGPGLGSWTIELPSKTIKLLKKAHKKSVKVRLTATATDRQKRKTTAARWITFR
ncbi:discoidin domain-containing protein [Baekduia sp. Peel2402]|uniref:discoidin domain-containing protein n=1 Tax=Baekduia sp. Peel2402 TaxID=3458296 RepID=UPI00403E6591